MKRMVCILLLAVLFALSGCSLQQPGPGQEGQPVQELHEWPEGEQNPLDVPVVYATMTVQEFGVIELELYPQVAPQTVCNFVHLARSGFYDGLTVHRVVKGFMVQGGDPEGTGYGGPGYCIVGEFSQNGFTNELKHERGVISMARSQEFDSAGSQFFIMHEDEFGYQLDSAYAAFGKVTSGIEVVDAIAAVNVNSMNNHRPYNKVIIESITVDAPLLPEPEKLPEQ